MYIYIYIYIWQSTSIILAWPSYPLTQLIQNQKLLQRGQNTRFNQVLRSMQNAASGKIVAVILLSSTMEHEMCMLYTGNNIKRLLRLWSIRIWHPGPPRRLIHRDIVEGVPLSPQRIRTAPSRRLSLRMETKECWKNQIIWGKSSSDVSM